MRRLFFLFLLLPLWSLAAETSENELLDDALDAELAALGVADGEELRLLRGNFYYSYLNGQYYRTLYYLDQWEKAEGAEGAPELEAEVMRAAVYLALGLEEQAEAKFFAVAEQGGGASGDAWYFLAQRLLNNADYDGAEIAAINSLRADPALSPRYEQELRSILVSAVAQQNRIEEAKSALAGMLDKSIWTGYARYNLILAMIRQNHKSRDLEALIDEAVYYLPKDEEGRSLRDRVLLLAGIAAMEREKHKLANRYFRDISLETVFSAPALLHYGWNLLAEWKYEDAIQPWRILQRMYDPYHPAVVESLLAVPHTLELVEAVNQSVLAYERIEDNLSVMVDELRSSNQPELLDAWLEEWRLTNAQQDWGWERQQLTDLQDSPVTRFTQGLLDDDAFVRQLAVLHDLDRIQADLADMQRTLALWDEVLVVRRQHLENLGGDALFDQMEERQMDVLRKVLAVQDKLLDEDETVFSYASESDKVRIERLRNVVGYVTSLQKIGTPTRDLAPYKERWRRMRGIQLWDIYEEQPQRKWDTERDHMKLRSETDSLFAQLEHTRTSLQWAESSWRGFPEQVQNIQARISATQALISTIQLQQADVLKQYASEYMDDLDRRLTLYLSQARLALARLYDDSLQKHVVENPEVGQ